MTRALHPAAPLAFALPGGIVAEYIAGSSPPAYTVDGQPIAVDVVIPPDLAAAGWYWHGTSLTWQDDARRYVSIDTATYPPPGLGGAYRDCFMDARALTRLRPMVVQETMDL